jgi:hypothetical protein
MKLSGEVQAFIVQCLARFDAPARVVELVRENFGLDVSRQQVESYNADRLGEKPARKWIQLFREERKRFLKDLSDIPEANRAVRIRRLARIAAVAEAKKNFALAAQMYEQIAKEVGRVYTNRQKLKHTGDKDQPLGWVFMPEMPAPVGTAALPHRHKNPKE